MQIVKIQEKQIKCVIRSPKKHQSRRTEILLYFTGLLEN